MVPTTIVMHTVRARICQRIVVCKQCTSSSVNHDAFDVRSGASESARNPYLVDAVCNSPTELAHVLAQRVIASNKHFVVINKPAGLSVWGHSLAKWEALSLLEKHNEKRTDCHLSVKDCLPELAKLLDPRWSGPGIVAEHARFEHNGRAASADPSAEIARGCVPSLHIVEPLPADYSGLILLARTPEYAKAAERFYQAALFTKPPWYLYQRFVAVCIGHPARATVHPVEPFPIASYPLNSHLSCSYRPTPSELSVKQRRRGNILYKYIGHDILCRNRSQASLVTVQANSTYRGLVELYLLHEGCTVVGELLQSSRLVTTGLGTVVLHPSKVTLGQTHPLELRRRLGNPGFDRIPVHLHRTSLLIPTPLGGRSASADDHFRALVAEPHGRIDTTRSECETGLRWTRLSHHKDLVNEPDSVNCRYALTCHSPVLPTYFPHTMERLGLRFDYASWMSSL